MRGWLFWITSGFVLAVVVHLSYVLVGTRFALQDMIASEAQAAAVGQLTLLSPEDQLRHLGEGQREAVAGRCLFDLNSGPLTIDAALPGSFWTLTIYSQSGEEIYSLNDRLAGTNRFSLTVKPAAGLLSFLTSDPVEKKLSEGWSVEMNGRRGFVVFWAALDQPPMRQAIARELERSTCTVQKSG
jgi:uncharacterized membrane protein